MEYSFHPYPIVGAVKVFLVAIILSVFTIIVSFILKEYTVLVLALIWVIIVFKMISIFVNSRYLKVTLHDNSVSYKVGIISHRSVVLPYHKITEASYSQGLIQRIFGVGTLKLDTAGGSVMAIQVPDVRFDDLKKTMDEINKKTGKDMYDD